MKIGLRKRHRDLDAFVVVGGSGEDAGGCTDKHWQFQCTCAVVFPLEDQSRQS